MESKYVVGIFFLVLVMVSIQYTLNKILVELKMMNNKLDNVYKREVKDERKYPS